MKLNKTQLEVVAFIDSLEDKEDKASIKLMFGREGGIHYHNHDTKYPFNYADRELRAILEKNNYFRDPVLSIDGTYTVQGVWFPKETR